MNWTSAVIGIAAPIAALISVLLVYQRGRRVDAVSESSGINVESRAGQAQINKGQQDLIALLQEDNKVLRQEFAELKAQFNILTKEVNRLYHKYGNGLDLPDILKGDQSEEK